jgi:hypothetical protein
LTLDRKSPAYCRKGVLESTTGNEKSDPAQVLEEWRVGLMTIDLVLVFWAILGCGILHIAEEYLTGWVPRFQERFPGMTEGKFWIVNALFLLLCWAAVVVNVTVPLFSLSAAALVLVNAVIHIANSVRESRYSPGLITATILYLPVGAVAYLTYAIAGLTPLPVLVGSLLLGIVWMVSVIIPVLLSSRKTGSARKGVRNRTSEKVRA